MSHWKKLGCLAALAGLAACSSGPQSRVSKGQIDTTMNEQAMGKNYIEGIGIGAADATLASKTQRMATSRDAAIVASQHELLSLIKGERLTGGITVSKAMETDSKLQTSIDEVIKGAEVVKTEWTADDGCVVTMRIPKDRLEKAMGVQFQ